MSASGSEMNGRCMWLTSFPVRVYDDAEARWPEQKGEPVGELRHSLVSLITGALEAVAKDESVPLL